ncbi:uncharacterized protein LOC111089502 isoform X2 [Limulus polyphemus]|uniref:Uncharacterized protein LOC111089502 isoform X2 n=1 Tax=Limulus polyphemus TaxID=6850 RepID=A0ABM1TPN2_LIMPO|nr:uncharacterized protein LOC111089502 isoform X2 [Limulus polyphemus]
MYRLNIEFDTRVMCMYALDDDTMLLGSLSHFVYTYNTKSRKLIWEIRLNDSVLSLCSHDEDGIKKVYAGLADGTLAVIENIQGISPQPESFYIMIGPSPVTCLQRVATRLWCASGNRVIILNVRTLDVVDQFHISTSVLDYISMLVLGEHGVWVAIRGSPLLQLWDLNSLTCRLLYDVRENRYPKTLRKEEENGVKSSRVTSLLPFDGSLLVGTGEGALIIFDVVTRLSCNASATNSPFPRLHSPNIATADQIQEKIQELLTEQQRVEQKTEVRFSDEKQERYRKDSGCYTSTTPTSVVSLSRRQSLFPTCDNDQSFLSNNIGSPCKTSSSSGQLSTDTVVSVYHLEETNTKPEIQRTGEDTNTQNDDITDNAGVSYGKVNQRNSIADISSSLNSNGQIIMSDNYGLDAEDGDNTWSSGGKVSNYPYGGTTDQTQSDCQCLSSRVTEEVGQPRTGERGLTKEIVAMCKCHEEENMAADLTEKLNVSKSSFSDFENHSSFNKETYSNSHETTNKPEALRTTYSCEQNSDLIGSQSADMSSVSPKSGTSGRNVKLDWRKENETTSLERRPRDLRRWSVDQNVILLNQSQFFPSVVYRPTAFSDTDHTFGSSESVSKYRQSSHSDKSFVFLSVKPSIQKTFLSNSSNKFLQRSHSLGDLCCLKNTRLLKRTMFTTTSTEGLYRYKNADTLSVSAKSDSFDFDDVFITYTEDESHKLSHITRNRPEIKGLATPTCFESRRDPHKRKPTINNYLINSLQSTEMARCVPLGLKSSVVLKPKLPDIRDQLPSWYKDGLITESDHSCSLPVVRIDSETYLHKNDSCSSFYMYMAQASTTSNPASAEEFSTPVTENDELLHQNLLRPGDFSSSSTQKYSDTASNVSFGSSDFPYAYELILQERIKISDKPIRCLL